MSWIKIDDQFADHPKVLQAGPLASWLYVCGLTYCGRYLTDGWIPMQQVRKLADVDDPLGLAARLVAVGLWEEQPDGFIVHDYHDYNPTAEKVKADRAAAARRQADWRDGHRKEAGQYGTDEIPSNGVSNGVTDDEVTTAPSPSPSPSPVPVPIPAAAAAARVREGYGPILAERGILINGAVQADMWRELYKEAGPDLFVACLDEAVRSSPRLPTVNYVSAIVKRCLTEGTAPGQRTQTRARASPERQPPARASPPPGAIPEAPRRFRNPISGEVETV